MIDIVGDEIILEGVTIARFEKAAWPTLRERAESILDGAELDMIREKDHCSAIDEARREGESDAREWVKEEMRSEVDKARDKAYDEGYDAGRVAAFADIEQAKDAERIGKLLQAVSEAHDALFKVVVKRYPTCKLSELRSQAISSLSSIRLAVNAWRAPNGV